MEEKHTRGTWVQTERRAHEAWDLLIRKQPSAARLMHRLVASMDKRGAVVMSQKTLAEMMGVHRNTVNKAIKVLESDNWIETVQLGGTSGGVKAYLVNRRVAWADKRENQRFAAFDARIIVSASDQPADALKERQPLRQLPRAEEYQMMDDDGMDPPSQPALGSLEPSLPATKSDEHLQVKIEFQD